MRHPGRADRAAPSVSSGGQGSIHQPSEALENCPKPSRELTCRRGAVGHELTLTAGGSLASSLVDVVPAGIHR